MDTEEEGAAETEDEDSSDHEMYNQEEPAPRQMPTGIEGQPLIEQMQPVQSIIHFFDAMHGDS